MNDIYSLSSQEVFTYHPYRAPERLRNGSLSSETTGAEPQGATDSVEFSKSAIAISREQALESAAARADRLMRIRTMIDNNTYETPEKIRATASRLIEILDLA